MEAQRRQERFDRAVERAVAQVRQRLFSLQEQLRCTVPDKTWGEGFALLEMDSNWTRVCAGGPLVWREGAPVYKEASADRFAEGERLEFRDQKLDGAVAEYQRLFESPDPALKAGALLRLARVLRKTGRHEEALAAYGVLGEIGGALAGGGPAALVARRARCELLAGLGRESQARMEANLLAGDLDKGRWPVEQGLYEAYRSDVEAWSRKRREFGREHLARAVGLVRARWKSGQLGDQPWGSDWVRVNEAPFTVIWRRGEERLWALIADADFSQRHWLHAAQEGLQLQIASHPPVGDSQPARMKHLLAATTGLPWPIVADWIARHQEDRETASRRRLVLGLLGAGIVVILASGALLWRTYAREKALAQLQSDFVSTVSHEFRTPLTSMRQMTEALIEGRLPSEDRRHTYYEALARAAQRLQRLVESLLDFGRMEAGVMPYRREPLDGAAIVRGLEADFENEFGKRGFHLAVTYPERCSPFRGDRDALTQALWNLLDNAVKYSREPGTVRLDLECRNKQVRFIVRDQGIGIPPKERKLIFGRFTRGQEALTAGIQGTGIGLAMVDHIVKGHAGILEMESDPGRGSTFTIALPAER